jgi:hypothetical protein
MPPSKQLALREIPSPASTGLRENMKNTESYKFNKTQPMGDWPFTTSRLWYLHKLGNVNTVANYHEYYQTLIENGIANGDASNAYLTVSYVPVKTKYIITRYRIGTLCNQKHAVYTVAYMV